MTSTIVRPFDSANVHDVWHTFAGPAPSSLIIFGCGQLGHFVLTGVREAGLRPIAYCDNNPATWGTSIEGVPVMSPVEAAQRFGDGVPFLVAVYNGSRIRAQLRELGCRWIVPYPAFFWEYSDCLAAEERLAVPQHLLDHQREIEEVPELLADDRSKREYLAQIRWRRLLDYDCFPPHDSPSEMYFPRDLVRLTDDEVMVDCGAFDGDSIRLFLQKTGGKFKRIHAFEPDAGNIAALSAYIHSLPAEAGDRIEVRPYALGRENGTVHFCAEGSVGSKITAAGTVDIPCSRLDSVLSGVKPTFIKMDIEGAETDALAGASRIIAEWLLSWRCALTIAAGTSGNFPRC